MCHCKTKLDTHSYRAPHKVVTLNEVINFCLVINRSYIVHWLKNVPLMEGSCKYRTIFVLCSALYRFSRLLVGVVALLKFQQHQRSSNQFKWLSWLYSTAQLSFIRYMSMLPICVRKWSTEIMAWSGHGTLSIRVSVFFDDECLWKMSFTHVKNEK